MPDYQRFVGMCCSLCLFPLSARWTWSLLVFWFSLCMNVTCTSYLLNFAFPRKLKKQFLLIVVWQTALNIFICHTNTILTKLFQNFLLGQDSKMLQYTDFSAREKKPTATIAHHAIDEARKCLRFWIFTTVFSLDGSSRSHRIMIVARLLFWAS